MWILNVSMGIRMLLKILVTALLIALPAVLLGFFFPTGLRVIGQRSPLFIPWAWGINGGFTVIGSVFAIVLAMIVGFSQVLLVSAAVYVLGLSAYLRFVAVTDGQDRSDLGSERCSATV
jgi:hypothetical protein